MGMSGRLISPTPHSRECLHELNAQFQDKSNISRAIDLMSLKPNNRFNVVRSGAYWLVANRTQRWPSASEFLWMIPAVLTA